MIAVHHVRVDYLPGQWGMVPLTSVTFEYDGQFYGARYPGTLTPADIAGLREAFRARRMREKQECGSSS
jgi:hypothetical protein